jgi:signal peptidase I
VKIPPRGRAIVEIAETLVLTVVLFLGIQTFVAQPFKIEQGSMETTLMPEQYVLIDKLSPHWSAYARGDIVVFSPPAGWAGRKDTPLIKRVIGLPGDHVELRDGTVYFNGAALDEPYRFAARDGQQPTDPTGGVSDWQVPPGQLFVMGDHRQVSEDSRVFGPVPVSSVIGRAVLRYWPFDSFEVVQRPAYG